MTNFKEIKVLNIEGQEELVDFSKQIGNAMYTQGKDVDICECGKKIYYGEDVELTEEHKAFIKQLVEPYPYIFRSAIEKALG